MGKITNAVKQFKEVLELREENLELYNEKQYLEVKLAERDKEYDIANKRCQQYYKLFNEIKNIVNQNQNGSVLNLQNKIKTLLKEAKI